MKVIYVPYSDTIERDVLLAFKNRSEDMKITLGTSEVTMPMVVNITIYALERFAILGKSVYKWINEHRTLHNPSDAALDRLSFRIKRVVRAAQKVGMDMVVIYDQNENYDLIRDELKRWVKTK